MDSTHTGNLTLPVCRSLPYCRGAGGSVRGSGPTAGQSGRSQVWAVIHHSPTSYLCCCFSRDAGWKRKKTKGSEFGSWCWHGWLGVGAGWCILHFELLTVTLRQHTCVGEWEPATPKENEKKACYIYFFQTTIYLICVFGHNRWNESYILFFSFSP